MSAPISAPTSASLIPSTTRGRMHAAYVAALLLSEAILLIVVAKLIPKLIAGDDAEALSVWAVAGTLALGFGIAHLLGSRELSSRQRVFWGLLITVVALQIIGRADLAESASVWDMSWLIDLGRPSSDVWKRAGAIDEFFSALLLIPIWFRGVALGTADLDERPFTRTAFAGFVVLLFGFTLGDNAGIESIVQIAALAWVMTCVIAVALKNSSNPATAEEGSGIQTGLSLAATLFALTAGIAIVLLVVVGIVAGIAGAGVVSPVLSGIGFVLEHVIKGIAYAFWPLFWLFEQIVTALRPDEPVALETIAEGVGRPLGDLDENASEPDPTAGIVLVRVFGGIGAVLVLTVLAWLFFRRFLRRSPGEDEERESVWSEADILNDMFGGLRNLRGRFGRRGAEHQPDAPIAALYYEVLADADARGAARAPARTPLQFASVLRREYDSTVPADISSAFSAFRYAGQEPDPALFRRLREAWDRLIESE